jgi:hypothetical protein
VAERVAARESGESRDADVDPVEAEVERAMQTETGKIVGRKGTREFVLKRLVEKVLAAAAERGADQTALEKLVRPLLGMRRALCGDAVAYAVEVAKIAAGTDAGVLESAGVALSRECTTLPTVEEIKARVDALETERRKAEYNEQMRRLQEAAFSSAPRS